MTPYEAEQVWQERCDAQPQADLETYLDSQPEPPPPAPTCGMCIHFVPSRQLRRRWCDNSPAAFIPTPSYCSLRAAADFPCLYRHDSPADSCRFFELECPF